MSAPDRTNGHSTPYGGAPRNGGPDGAPIAPPQNLEAEQSVLGAVLLSDTALPALIIDERLHPDDFYREGHGRIYRAMLDLHTLGEPVDALTLVEHLKQAGDLESVGGRAAIDLLAGSVPAVGNVRQYARIVRDNAMLRRLLRASYDIQARVHSHEALPRDLVDMAERAILEVAHEDSRKDFLPIGDLLSSELEKLERLSREGKAITGTPSGFDDLDAITGGFQPGNLIILAARPSMGKSALMANFAENAALDTNKAVALFSLEMSEGELAQRFVASQASIRGDDLRKGKVPPSRWPKILQASNRLAQSPLYIDDSSDLSVLDVRAKSRRLAQQHADGLGLILIDYLQLMRASGSVENRVEQIGQISRGLKTLARELDVPVIALSQLNRGVEQRTDKRPVLSDLRESGCLAGETQIYLPDSGEYRRIDELVGLRDFRVSALNMKTWKLESCRVSNAFCTGRKPVFAMQTRLGRRLRATANHRFLTVQGWRRLDELKPGTHIALPRALPGPTQRTITDDELALLGHLIGDGCTLPQHAIMDELGAFGLRSHEKRIPAVVFAQPAEGIEVFLRHLWATDGCIWSSGTRSRVYYATSSETLASDVQDLLLRLGICATVRRVDQRRGRPQYHVDVTGTRDQKEFVLRVWAVGDRRERQALKLADRLGVTQARTNRDVIPATAWSTIVEPARVTAGITVRELQAQLATSYCGSTLYRANLGRERAERVASVVGSDELRRLAMSDVYWDRIEAIEADAAAEVYDLTVDTHHNFVGNGVIAHNSIEQDADLVMFIYRDEYYNDESDREGIADVIISKHRNGGLGVVELAFQKEFPRFMSYAGDDGY
jgi:replicative DNA helicase